MFYTFSVTTSSNRSPRRSSLALLILTLLLTCAFGLRIHAAISSEGFSSDLGINAGWAHSGVRFGLGQSYREQVNGNMLPDHPPMSIIAYTFIGRIFTEFANSTQDTWVLARSPWLRIPAIVADLITLIALFSLLYRGRGLWHATAVGAAHAFNPGVIGDSASWGQIDAVFTMWIVLSLVAFSRRWWIAFALCYVLAMLSKVQAMALLPFMAYLFLFRVPFWDQLKAVGGAAVAAAVVLFPFAIAGTLPQVHDAYTGAIGQYSALSMNAYNLWWLLYPTSTDRSSTDVAIGFLTFRQVGLVLFVAVAGYAIALYHFFLQSASRTKKTVIDDLAPFGVASLTFFAFFAFNAEMHERYLFPAMVLLLPFLTYNWRLSFVCIATTVLFWLNLAGVMYISPLDGWVFATFPNVRSVIALSIVVLCIGFASSLRGTMLSAARTSKAHRARK